nr:uncharacterized protein LOC113820231 [Penaeus vannamei]
MVGGALAAPRRAHGHQALGRGHPVREPAEPSRQSAGRQRPPGGLPLQRDQRRDHRRRSPAEAPEEAAPKEHPTEAKPAPHREPMERDLPPVALASRWPFHGPRSIRLTRPRHQQVSPARAGVRGNRHKRDLRPLTRRPRDLASNVNLDNLLRNVDVVELLGLLSRGGAQGGPVGAGPVGAGAVGAGPRARNHQLGFGTLSYAPMTPAVPNTRRNRARLPEYEEDEDEDEGVEAMGQGPRGQQWYPVAPAGGRVWRRSGALGLSAVPGFKRSAFRANNMQAQRARNQDDDLYSLAAMLGAELDPVTHRIQRAAM